MRCITFLGLVSDQNHKPQTSNLKLLLHRFFEVTCSDTACADGSLFYAATFLDPDGLQIGKIAPFRLVMGMTDVVPHHGAFSTYIASAGHFRLLNFFGLIPLYGFCIAGKDLDC